MMNMWPQNTQRRGGNMSDFPQQGARLQQQMQSSMRQNQNPMRQNQNSMHQNQGSMRQNLNSMLQNQNSMGRGQNDDFDYGGELLFERRNRNDAMDSDIPYDDNLYDDNSQDNMNKGRAWQMGDERRGGGGSGSRPVSRPMELEPLMSKNTFNMNKNWMGDDRRGMMNRGMNLDFDMPQDNFNQNRNWMSDNRRSMSRPVDSNNSMFQNNFNQNRNQYGMNRPSDMDNSMPQNNFNQNNNRNWSGDDRRGMKRPMENNFGSFQNNMSHDKPNWLSEKRTRQSNDKKQTAPAPPADNKLQQWEAKWNEKYPNFRVPSNYKLVQKWEKCLQPQNAIQIFNQLVKSGVEIPCQEEPREENPSEELLGVTMFSAHAKVDGQSFKGSGPSKKLAQHSAAENAIKTILKNILNDANIKKEICNIEIDRNDMVPWNYITSFALFKFLTELQSHDPNSHKPNTVIATPPEQKSAPPQELPPNAVDLNPYKLLFKMKPGITITRLTEFTEPHVEFETIIDTQRFTGKGPLPQDARKALAKNVLTALYGLVYPEEEPNSAAPGELPKNAAFWNPYKLLLRMKPNVVITRLGAPENSQETPVTIECSVDGQLYTETGRTMNEARANLGRKICQALYGIKYPNKQSEDKGEVKKDVEEAEKPAP